MNFFEHTDLLCTTAYSANGVCASVPVVVDMCTMPHVMEQCEMYARAHKR
jgi:hypothetical protein